MQQDRKLSPAGPPTCLTSLAPTHGQTKGVGEGKRGQKKGIETDLKIDLAMKGDIHKLLAGSPPDSAPGFQEANGDFSGNIPAPPRSAPELAAPRVTSSLAGVPLSPRMLFPWTGPPLSPALSSGADPSCLPTLSGPRPGRTPPPGCTQGPGDGPLAGLLPPALHLRPHPDCLSGLKDLLEPWSSPRGQPPTRVNCHPAPSPRRRP